jgi:phosphoglycerate dehydrogenase-like enzyme
MQYSQAEVAMNRPGVLLARAFGGAIIAAGMMTNSASAQQAAPAAKVMTPSGPVDGPLDLDTALRMFPLNEGAKPSRELLPGWRAPKKLVVIVDRPERTAWLQQAMPAGVRVAGFPSDAAAAKDLGDADAYVMAAGDCTPANWVSSGVMKWVHSSSGGSDHCLSAAPVLGSGKILFTNSQKVKSDSLSENAFGFIFALARNMDIAVDNQRAGAFGSVRATRPAKSLEGATMLVVGLGGAGTEIARLAHEFGMTVIATRATSHDGPTFVKYVGLPNELPNMIGEADVVVVAAPLTPDTRNLFNSAMFSKMKKGAMLVNFTRAEIVNAEDLAAALRDGRLGSAGLAWATGDPLPKGHPLWSAPNLILTPWQGSGGSPGAQISPGTAREPDVPAAARGAGPATGNPALLRDNELRWLLVRENMRRFASGERMYSLFDVKRGY